MTLSHSFRCCGQAATLCFLWGAIAMAADDSLPWSSPSSPTAVAPIVPHSAAPQAVTPGHMGSAAQSIANCHPPRGHFNWFRRQPADSTAHYDGLCSGCNVHPEPPFGASYNATMQAQIAKGEAALMVLYHYDFVPGQASLNYRGRLQLQKIARLVPQNPFPIIIEATRHDSELDAARYASVVSELSWLPFPVPAERIVIGLPPARAMDGLDGEIVHQNLLNMTSVGGATGQTATPGSGMGMPVPPQ